MKDRLQKSLDKLREQIAAAQLREKQFVEALALIDREPGIEAIIDITFDRGRCLSPLEL